VKGIAARNANPQDAEPADIPRPAMRASPARPIGVEQQDFYVARHDLSLLNHRPARCQSSYLLRSRGNDWRSIARRRALLCIAKQRLTFCVLATSAWRHQQLSRT
jgi:hypothetical protein